MEKFLQKMKSWLGKVRHVPLIGGMAADLMTVLDLVADYHRGIYRNIPRGTVFALTAALAYALCPIDLILDAIPFAGLLDDAAILGLMLDFGMAGDLLRYRTWRETLRADGRKALRENRVTEFLTLIGKKRLGAALLTENRQIKLLLCPEGETHVPIHCCAVLTDICEAQLSALGVESWEDIGAFYTEVFEDPRFSWSALGRRPFMPEYDPGAKTDDFIVEN